MCTLINKLNVKSFYYCVVQGFKYFVLFKPIMFSKNYKVKQIFYIHVHYTLFKHEPSWFFFLLLFVSFNMTIKFSNKWLIIRQFVDWFVCINIISVTSLKRHIYDQYGSQRIKEHIKDKQSCPALHAIPNSSCGWTPANYSVYISAADMIFTDLHDLPLFNICHISVTDMKMRPNSYLSQICHR